MVKNLPAMVQTWVQSQCQEDSLKEEMATHASILAWRIPRTEELLLSMGLHRVRHDWATNTFTFHTFTYMYVNVQVTSTFAARGRQSEYQKTIINSGKMRYLKIKNSALCCVWEDASTWAHWNHFFHTHLSYPGPATRFLIFHILNSSFTSFLVQLTAAGSQALFSVSGALWPKKFIFEGLNSLMAVISLFIDMARDIPFHSPNPQYLPLTVTLFGDKVFKEVTKVKSGHWSVS